MVVALVNVVPEVLLFSALLGCTTDGPVAVRESWRMARVGGRLGHQAVQRLKAVLRRKRQVARYDTCPAEQERREQRRREFTAYDVFKNTTEHEEYRPS
jgi:hypothetical protein